MSRYLAGSHLRRGVTDAQLVTRYLDGESMAELGVALCRKGHDGSGCVGACKLEVQDRIRRKMLALRGAP